MLELRTLRRGLNEEAKITELIDWDTKRWKISLVRELFGVAKAIHICQIPIGSIHNSDRQIWSATIDGEFTVRSYARNS